MARNRSEKGPVLVALKHITPAQWNVTSDILMFRLPDGTWRVAGNWSSNPEWPAYRISDHATEEDAAELYKACCEDLWWHELNDRWPNHTESPQPLHGTGFIHAA